MGRKLSQGCENVSTWMKSNLLKLNPGKTHVMTLGTSQRLKITNQMQVFMDGLLLQENSEQTENLLGCKIQANLKWQKQVQALHSKLRARLLGLGKLKSFAQAAIRKTITEGLFNSILVYCLPLFGGMDTGNLKDLQILQNKAEYYHSVISVFKIRNSGQPEYLATRLLKDSRNGRIMIPEQLYKKRCRLLE